MPIMSFIVFPSHGETPKALRFCNSIDQSQCLVSDQKGRELLILTLDRMSDQELSDEIEKIESQNFVAGISLVSAFSEEQISDESINNGAVE